MVQRVAHGVARDVQKTVEGRVEVVDEENGGGERQSAQMTIVMYTTALCGASRPNTPKTTASHPHIATIKGQVIVSCAVSMIRRRASSDSFIRVTSNS